MIRLFLLGLVLFLAPPAEARDRGACVDGVDCYCDCVEDTSSASSPSPADANFATDFCKTQNIPIDPLIFVCEDFENPTYEHSHRDFNGWHPRFQPGTTGCTDGGMTPTFDYEGDDAQCRNILQANTTTHPNCAHISGGGLRPNTVGTDGFSAFVYSAADNDLNEGALYGSGFDGTWDGCQTLATHIAPGKKGGRYGEMTQSTTTGALPDSTNYSSTYMQKWNNDHFMGQAVPTTTTTNFKGDRFYTNPITSVFHTLSGGSGHGLASEASACDVGSEFPGTTKYPFPVLLKSTDSNGGGIDGRGACCEAGCFADETIPGRPSIGIQEHQSTAVRFLGPAKSVWNPRVPGGVPLSVEGNKDGLDEWFCFRISLQNQGTDQMNYIMEINNVTVIRMENLPGGNDDSPIGTRLFWLHLISNSPGGNAQNHTSNYMTQVRDNYHLTRSQNPATCAAIGFGASVPPPPSVDPERTEGVDFGAGVSISYMLPWTRGPWVW